MGIGLLLVAVTVTVLVGLGAPSEDGGTAAGELPGASEPSEETALSEAGEPGQVEEPVVPPEGFAAATGTVLLFDDGGDGGLLVDLDTWERQRVDLPGQRAGDQPFRLWQLGGWVEVGWEEIWAVVPGEPERARQVVWPWTHRTAPWSTTSSRTGSWTTRSDRRPGWPT